MRSLPASFAFFVLLAALQEESTRAFVPRHYQGPLADIRISLPSWISTRTTAPFSSSSTSLRSSAAPTPNDESIREAYARWRQIYVKGDFDPVRYENFKANYLAVSARNAMDAQRARQNGETAPTPIKLNEYGDCSADEYRRIMANKQRSPNQQQQSMSSPTTAPSNQGTGLRPANAPVSNNPGRQGGSAGVRREDYARATAQLRAAMEQRVNLENEMVRLKQRLEEKQRLLQAAVNEENYCKQRAALREEQKRLLNDRLTNGWEDERGLRM
jgi:hypothetical protein